jgi:hypothetical protein
MFQRFKKALTDAKATAQDLASGPPPDLFAIPTFPAEAHGLDEVDPAVLGAYVGLEVQSILALGTPGTGPTLDAARLDRLRAEGMSEEQLRQAVDFVASKFANQWKVTFTNGNSATVKLFPNGDDHGDFDRLRSEWQNQQTKEGARAMRESPLLNRVHEVASPYETYENGASVVARGPVHEGLAQSHKLGTAHYHEALAGLLAAALRVVDGP